MSGGPRSDPRRLASAVIELLEDELSAEGYELLDVRVFRGGGRLQLRIYLDLPAGGITLDQCAAASRSIGMLLEEADLIAERYVIEVSSPGIRRPLRTSAHFAAARGERVDLRTRDGRHVRGRLAETGPGGHVVVAEAEDAEPVTVPAAEVIEANLDPDFDARSIIGADRRARKAARRERRRRERGARGKRGGGESGDDDRSDGST